MKFISAVKISLLLEYIIRFLLKYLIGMDCMFIVYVLAGRLRGS